MAESFRNYDTRVPLSCDECGKDCGDHPSGWCKDCYEKISEAARIRLFWKNLFDGSWHLINNVTRTFNVLGMKHWAVKIEEWWNYKTRETKIITHYWEDGKWRTEIRSK